MSLFGLFESRANLESPSTPISSSSILSYFGGGSHVTGKEVTETTSMRMSAVWRCANLLSSVPASLPLGVYRRGTLEPVTTSRNSDAKSPIEDLNPEISDYDLWRLSYLHRALWGNAYFQKIYSAQSGVLKQLWPIHPDRVRVALINGEKVFAVQDENGTEHLLTSRDILHFPGLGYDGITGMSVISHAAQAISLGLSAEEHGARVFSSGSLMSGILSTDQKLQPSDAERLKQRWHDKITGLRNAQDIAVLDSGASFTPVSMPHTDAQFLESRHFEVEEIARFFGVPMFLMMATEKQSNWGTGLAQQSTGFVMYDLHPTWLKPTEENVTKQLLSNRQYARYNVSGLLRGDAETRSDFYQAMIQSSVYSINEVREMEAMPPIEDGDIHLQPLNYAPLGTVSAENAPEEQGEQGGRPEEGE